LDWSNMKDLSRNGAVRKSIAAVVEAINNAEAPRAGERGHSFNAMQVDPLTLQDYGNSISAGPRLANNKAQFLSKGVYKAVEGYSPAVRGTLGLFQTVPRKVKKEKMEDGAGGGGGAEAQKAVAGRKLADGRFEAWSGRSVGGKAGDGRGGGGGGGGSRPNTSMSLRDRLYAKMNDSPAVEGADKRAATRLGGATRAGMRDGARSAPLPCEATTVLSCDQDTSSAAAAAATDAGGGGGGRIARVEQVDGGKDCEGSPRPATALSLLSGASTAGGTREAVTAVTAVTASQLENATNGLKSKYKVLGNECWV